MQNLIWALSLLILISSCANDVTEDNAEQQVKSLKELPFDQIPLQDLAAFANTGPNWGIVGSAFSDYEQEHDLGTKDGEGVLVCKPTDQSREHLSTGFEHQDIELKFEVLVPKGSNSGIYFMGRYEIQLFDSWLVTEPTHSDIGGIYERWDDSRPEGRKGFEGVAPMINAGLAPGLWQKFHISFKAPRFDASGQKTKNALFEFVYLNDQLIHKDQEVTGPTRAHQLENEAPMGPLYIQGDHGPVAFRNIEYKLYQSDTIALSNIAFTSYLGRYGSLPDFDTLSIHENGAATSFDPTEVAPQNEEYALIYKGQMEVPYDGEYLFEIGVDDGAALYIDDQQVISNDTDPEYTNKTGIVYLDKGSHNYQLAFRQEVWSAKLDLSYEGPFIARRTLGAKPAEPALKNRKRNRIILAELEHPTLLRGFVMHENAKLTHAISIGDPAGIHYSYDLPTGTLAKIWRGPFGDVTEMWQGRGIQQILSPTSTAPQLTLSYISTKPLSGLQWSDDRGVKYEGYSIDPDDQRPIFEFTLDGRSIRDKIIPGEYGLIRQITSTNGDMVYLRIGTSGQIEKIRDNMFSLGNVFITTEQPEFLSIQELETSQELIAKIDQSFSYELIW